jgi:hypothetical protein
LFESGDNKTERLIPTRTLEYSVAFYQWVLQPVGMMRLQIRRDALWTETPLIHRKFVPRLDTDDAIVFNEQLHPALHTAVRTMGIHDLVYNPISLPPAVRRIMQMRAKFVEYLFEIFYFAHI